MIAGDPCPVVARKSTVRDRAVSKDEVQRQPFFVEVAIRVGFLAGPSVITAALPPKAMPPSAEPSVCKVASLLDGVDCVRNECFRGTALRGASD